MLPDPVKLHCRQVDRNVGKLIKLTGLDAYRPAKFYTPPACDFRRLMDVTMEREFWLVFVQKVINRL